MNVYIDVKDIRKKMDVEEGVPSCRRGDGLRARTPSHVHFWLRSTYFQLEWFCR